MKNNLFTFLFPPHPILHFAAVQGIESCADSLLESSSNLRDSASMFGARRRRQIKRATREAAKTRSSSRFVNEESQGDSEAEEKLKGVLSDDDRGALEEVMITASKGFAFNHAGNRSANATKGISFISLFY
jgi:hypothetical protein